MLLVACSDAEAERLVKQATRQAVLASERADNDLAAAADGYRQALGHLTQVLEEHPDSALARQLRAGSLKVAGMDLVDLRQALARVDERLGWRADSNSLSTQLARSGTPWEALAVDLAWIERVLLPRGLRADAANLVAAQLSHRWSLAGLAYGHNPRELQARLYAHAAALNEFSGLVRTASEVRIDGLDGSLRRFLAASQVHGRSLPASEMGKLEQLAQTDRSLWPVIAWLRLTEGRRAAAKTVVRRMRRSRPADAVRWTNFGEVFELACLESVLGMPNRWPTDMRELGPPTPFEWPLHAPLPPRCGELLHTSQFNDVLARLERDLRPVAVEARLLRGELLLALETAARVDCATEIRTAARVMVPTLDPDFSLAARVSDPDLLDRRRRGMGDVNALKRASAIMSRLGSTCRALKAPEVRGPLWLATFDALSAQQLDKVAGDLATLALSGISNAPYTPDDVRVGAAIVEASPALEANVIAWIDARADELGDSDGPMATALAVGYARLGRVRPCRAVLQRVPPARRDRAVLEVLEHALATIGQAGGLEIIREVLRPGTGAIGLAFIAEKFGRGTPDEEAIAEEHLRTLDRLNEVSEYVLRHEKPGSGVAVYAPPPGSEG